MVKVFELSARDGQFGILRSTDDPDPLRPNLAFVDAKPLAATWRPVEVEIYWFGHYDKHRSRRLEEVDFPNHAVQCLIMSRRAKVALQEYLARFGELLPLKCAERELWAFNVLKVVDAVDPTRSAPTYSALTESFPAQPIGEPIGFGPPYAFFTERLQDADIFKVRNIRGFFMTEKFKQNVESLGLTGLALRQVFDSETDRYGFDWKGNPRKALIDGNPPSPTSS